MELSFKTFEYMVTNIADQLLVTAIAGGHNCREKHYTGSRFLQLFFVLEGEIVKMGHN